MSVLLTGLNLSENNQANASKGIYAPVETASGDDTGADDEGLKVVRSSPIRRTYFRAHLNI